MKKELFVTPSMAEYAELCALLRENGIRYKTRVTDQTGASARFAGLFGSTRRARGSLGERSDFMKFYNVYVDARDLDEATFYLQKLRRR